MPVRLRTCARLPRCGGDAFRPVRSGGRRPDAWRLVIAILALSLLGAAADRAGAGAGPAALAGAPVQYRVRLAAPLAEPAAKPGAALTGLAGFLDQHHASLRPALTPRERVVARARADETLDRRFGARRAGTPDRADAADRGATEARAAIDRLGNWYTLVPATPAAAAENLPLTPLQLARLSTQEGVEAVEATPWDRVCAIPSDPSLNSQPYLGLVDAFRAYDVVRGADGEVVVAVVDGGTDWQHVDLAANVWQRPGEIDGNGLDDDGNGYVDDVRGWNFAGDTPDPRGLPATPFNGRHGTHIAGVIGAVSDNGIGVSGVSWNARLLLVNVGHPTSDTFIAYGYEGLVYAALSGARIANASWGRSGRWSQYEADVIAAVTAMGTLVVAAAGNDGADEPFYPAIYPGVLSVTAVDPNLVLPPLTNFAPWIDVCAPGQSIYATYPGGQYGPMSGTSQAAAIASGIAALLATYDASRTPAQLAEQLRWTTRSVLPQNPQLDERLGTGLVQARAALLDRPPGITADRVVLADEDGDGLPEPGELLTVGFDLRNELAAAQDVALTLISEDPSVVLLENTLRLNGLATGATLQTRRGLRFWVRPEATTAGALANIRVRIEAAGRRAHCAFYPEIAPLYATVRSQRVHLSVTSSGKIGYSALTRGYDPGGEGLHPPGQGSRLLVGSLLVGDGPTRVSDAAIDPLPDDLYEDFHPQEGQGLSLSRGGEADEEVVAHYSDRAALVPMDVNVRQIARAYHDAERGGFVLCRYEVTATDRPISGGRLGVLVDWEVAQGATGADRVAFDPALGLGYGYDASAGDDGPAVGAVLLDGPGAVWGGWLFEEATEGYVGPTLFGPPPKYPKISDAGLWELMTRPPDPAPSPPGDVAQVLAMGPFDLLVGQTASLTVAFVVGADRAELLREARNARLQFDGFQAGFPRGMPARPVLLPSAPNPFNPTTEIRFTLPLDARVHLRILDARGRVVGVPLDGWLPAGFHRLSWDGTDGTGTGVASGVYHILLETPWGASTRPITLLQ